MARRPKKAKTTNQDIYQAVTDKIIGMLKQGVVPWRKPWRSDPNAPGMGDFPVNLKTKSTYRGVNVFLLMATAAEYGYTSNYWCTYKQAKALGGHVRKGETSKVKIVFWRIIEKKTGKKNDKGEAVKDRIPLLRCYSVFNTDQCDGLEDKLPAKPEPEAQPEPVDPSAPNPACEEITAAYTDRPEVSHGGNRAYYRPATDEIGMPKQEQFESMDEYYSTLFHEYVHSTGHKSRLNRDGITELAAFGDHNYSREELVAEMGAAFLSARAGIDSTTIDNSASYLANWLKKLEDDPKMVIWAAGRAQKAADHIMGNTKTESEGA